MNPKVSFLVPCYNLAHYLSECVNSILMQTFQDFEILIMDDCSPDNTSKVAESFNDPRVSYHRNENNLGNIRNYNKGIELSRGEYVWLVSADDCLKSNDVLRKYVELLDRNPQVGYAFCPAVTIEEGKDTGVLDWSAWPGGEDRILKGAEVVERAIVSCPVCAPTGIVRKTCYDTISTFPISLNRTGDYYLWTMFAVSHDVGYFAEPMVRYRLHPTNMEKIMERQEPASFYSQELQVIWSIKQRAEQAGMNSLSPGFAGRLVEMYTYRLVKREVENWTHGPNWESAFEEIKNKAFDKREAENMIQLLKRGWAQALAHGYYQSGIYSYKAGRLEQAVPAFRSALTHNPWRFNAYVYLFASTLEHICGIRLLPWLKRLKNPTRSIHLKQS